MAILSDEVVTQAREKLGLADTVPDDQLGEVLLDAATAGGAQVAEMTLSLSRAELERDEAIEDRDRLQGEALAFSRQQATPPTAREIYQQAEIVKAKEAAALQAGVTPATIALARKKFCGKQLDPSTISLSRAVEPDDHLALRGLDLMADVLDVLAANGGSAPTGGEGSGPQVLPFGRQTPGEEKKDDAHASEVAEARKNRDEELKARGFTP